jgi:hypothetical protein
MIAMVTRDETRLPYRYRRRPPPTLLPGDQHCIRNTISLSTKRPKCRLSELISIFSILHYQELLHFRSTLSPSSTTPAMALPLLPGLTPPELAFICEMELVTVIPRQRMNSMPLLSVSDHLIWLHSPTHYRFPVCGLFFLSAPRSQLTSLKGSYPFPHAK